MSTIRSQDSNITLLLPPGAALSAYDRTVLPEDQQTASSQNEPRSGDGNVSAVGHTAVGNATGAHSVAPQTFIDAMKVRKTVFVDEQGVPLENELDEEDEYSFHWVVYGKPVEDGKEQASYTQETAAAGGGVSPGTVPAGTLRLVPPLTTSLHDHINNTSNEDFSSSSATTTTIPTSAHIYAHTGIEIDPSLNAGPPLVAAAPADFPTSPAAIANLPTSHAQPTAFPATEPYARLSRLAITPPYRRLGLARKLVDEALDWTRLNPEVVARRITGSNGGAVSSGSIIVENGNGRNGGGGRKDDGHASGNANGSDFVAGARAGRWDGLVVIHAQTHPSAVQFWEKVGFRRDTGMGVWNEEGIVHVGMWMRLRLDEE